MEHLMAPFLTIILLTFATDHISGQMIIASQNPLPVGSNVTLSLSNKTTIIIGSLTHESNTVLIIFNSSPYTFPMWEDRVTFNHNSAEFSIRSLQVSDSGLYKLSGGQPSFEAEIALSVQEIIVDVTLRASGAHLVELNDSVVLTCSVSNGTSLSYTWTKNGSLVTAADGGVLLSGEGAVLTIAAVSRDDQGPFVCGVHNGVSDGASAPLLLDISYGPTDTKMAAIPAMAAYKTGSNVTLSCHTESRPAASVRWFFNGMDLGLDGPQIQLKHTEKNQTGYYKCVLHNAVTSRYSSVETMVRIMDPISHVVISHAGGPVIMGQSVTLRCDVNASVAAISWWKNGVAVTASNTTSLGNNSLTFNPVMYSDTGHYQCRAVDLVSDMFSSPYMLIVYHGPEMPVIAGPSGALEGARVTLVCSASSLPPSQYSWYFNGSPVANGSQYVTGPLTMDMSGEYMCMAFNKVTGRNAMAYATLTVYEPITHVHIESPPTKAMQGLSFTLTCNATGGVDHVYWMKNGHMLYADNTTALSMHNHTLTFNQLHKEDTGLYQCMASNAVTNLTSPAFALQVIFGPYTPTIMGPLIAETGDYAVFHCNASSYPPSYYHWYHNETPMGNDSHFATGPLSFNMSGVYTCTAVNKVTEKNSTNSMSLTVIEAIERVVVKRDSLPIQSHNFTLSCEVAGPYDFIYWMKDGVRLSGDNSSANGSHVSHHMKNDSLHFSPVMTYDDGVYRCVAVNAVRQHPSPDHVLLVNYGPLKVHVEGPHIAPTGSGISVVFTCSAESRPTSQFRWFIGNAPAVVEAGPQLSILSTIPNVALTYTCQAYNNVTNIVMTASKTFSLNDAPSHSAASPRILLFMALSALSLPMLGDVWFN